MTIAVTGGTGFVGQAFLEEAIRQNVSVRALVRRDQAPRQGVDWVRGDLADQVALAELVRGASVVFHIAGVVNTPDPAGFHCGNVEGTRSVVEAARAEGTSRFIFVSSLSAREPGLSAYGRSKAHAEKIVQDSALDWVILRPPAIYGPRDREMLELFRAARLGVVPMPPAGRASMLHVEDLARLLMALMRSAPETSQKVFEPDDGRANGWSHREMAKAIGEAVGRQVWVPRLPKPVLMAAARLDKLVRGSQAKLSQDRVGYMCHPDWVSAPSMAVPSAVWRAEIPTQQGLASTASWYRDQRWL